MSLLEKIIFEFLDFVSSGIGMYLMMILFVYFSCCSVFYYLSLYLSTLHLS